jgi:hypothetical protein
VKQKLFVDELFELKIGQGRVIPVEPKYYDIKQNHANEHFLKELIRMPPSILPI